MKFKGVINKDKEFNSIKLNSIIYDIEKYFHWNVDYYISFTPAFAYYYYCKYNQTLSSKLITEILIEYPSFINIPNLINKDEFIIIRCYINEYNDEYSIWKYDHIPIFGISSSKNSIGKYFKFKNRRVLESYSEFIKN